MEGAQQVWEDERAEEGAALAQGGCDTMSRRADHHGEHFRRVDKGRDVRPELRKEVAHTVDQQER